MTQQIRMAGSIKISLIIASMFVATVATATLAHADDPLAKPASTTARDHLTEGNKLYRLREFEKAIEAYKAGALVEDVPVFHYNLGQCYRQLGRYSDAIWHYERFIERAKPTGQIRGAVDAFVTQMKSELENKAKTQLPIEPAPEPKPVSTPRTTKVLVPGEAWYRDRLAWGLSGAGLVGVGVASWLLVDANGLDRDSNSEPVQGEREQLRDRASRRRTLGALLVIGGGGLLATGFIKLAVRPADREHTITTSWNVGISGDGIFAAGRF
jgi:tetratricopeptide (TPR) repeat protein